MKVLVACEESQEVTKELRKLGVEAYSCDILECSGGFPEWHIKGDVRPLLKEPWDMVIAFPPCTFLTCTGNKWFNVEVYGDKAIQRAKDREEAIAFFMEMVNANAPHIAIENPVGVMSTIYRKPSQIIQPYYFGDPFEKKTCLWLKDLPNLKPTNIVEVPPRVRFDSGKSMASWYYSSFGLKKEERARFRSKTFHGVAVAMATQWVEYIRSKEK